MANIKRKLIDYAYVKYVLWNNYNHVSRKWNKAFTPHFHAEYQDDEVVISLNGEVLEGGIPNKKLKLVLAWAEIHDDELLANWKLLSEGKEYFKIEPLH